MYFILIVGFQLLLLQFQMGSAITELSKEREATAGELKRVCELEHQLDCVECRLSIERVAWDDLELEASCHAKEL